ncbi:MAG: T9SS type A sorting domain-containing protein [Candidatus Cloacimonetes bacterium]|nr:T9SS type A sorting domain-containing protein [Candidatus Cloacimonadota bacterium]
MLKQNVNPDLSGKKITILTILSLLCFSFALANITNDTQQPGGKESIPVKTNYNKENLIPVYQYGRDNTPVPEYEFLKFPTTIMTSYYDYMPGSYNSYPLRMQTDHCNGFYITFFGQPSTTSTRRQYWAYLDSTFSLVDWGTITTNDIRQGYGGIGIHPATGDCIASWHEQEIVLGYGTTISFDDFDLIEIPGFWSFYLFIPPEAPEVNEYIWPYIDIGPSPLGDGYVRVYQRARNYTHDAFGNPCEDERIFYIDVENYNGMDLSPILELANWSEVTVFTDWRAKSIRAFQTFAIDYTTPGKVAFFGSAIWGEGDLGDMQVEEGCFVWESYDYGETWDYANLHSDGPGIHLYKVENIPQIEDPEQNILDSLEVLIFGTHYTGLFDSEGNMHVPFEQNYGYYAGEGSFYMSTVFRPQAEVVWNGQEFLYHEVPEMPGIDSFSGHSVPWEIDPLTGDTLFYDTITWSLYPGDSGLFHHNTQKQAINLENNWIAQVWVDGTHHHFAEEGTGDPNYLEHPIVYISVTSDNGETWSEPIELTDIYYPDYDFSEEITVFPYVYDQIVDLGDDWGQIYMYYMDDNSFGSFAGSEPSGENNGGQINFCSIKIHFIEQAVDPDHTNITNLSLTNYPNPFNPDKIGTTCISFSSPIPILSNHNSTIKIYNTKGQLVRTLETSAGSTPSKGFAIWDGKDSYNNDVANGIYFYKLQINNGSITKKMLVIR